MVQSSQLLPSTNTQAMSMPKVNLDPRWLTPDQAAEFLGVGRQGFYKMVRRGDFGTLNRREINKRAVYYWQPDLERYLQAMAGPPPGADQDQDGQP